MDTLAALLEQLKQGVSPSQAAAAHYNILSAGFSPRGRA